MLSVVRLEPKWPTHKAHADYFFNTRERERAALGAPSRLDETHILQRKTRILQDLLEIWVCPRRNALFLNTKNGILEHPALDTEKPFGLDETLIFDSKLLKITFSVGCPGGPFVAVAKRTSLLPQRHVLHSLVQLAGGPLLLWRNAHLCFHNHMFYTRWCNWRLALTKRTFCANKERTSWTPSHRLREPTALRQTALFFVLLPLKGDSHPLSFCLKDGTSLFCALK